MCRKDEGCELRRGAYVGRMKTLKGFGEVIMWLEPCPRGRKSEVATPSVPGDGEEQERVA